MSFALTHFEPAVVWRHAGIYLFSLFAAFLFAVPAQADSTSLAARSRTIEVAVLGDSVAHDLGRGMENLFSKNRHIRIVRQTKFSTGLVRTDYYNWNAVARKFLKHHSPDVVIIVLGGNDHQDIRTHGRRYDPLSKRWIAEYERRVAHFMDLFKNTHAKRYWVGLPPVRPRRLNKAYVSLNRIYRRVSKRHGFHYVDVWDKLLSASGAYTSFGESLEGVRRQIRKNDGEHFTLAGQKVYASYVAHAIGLR